jgi:hypothetical protein
MISNWRRKRKAAAGGRMKRGMEKKKNEGGRVGGASLCVCLRVRESEEERCR